MHGCFVGKLVLLLAAASAAANSDTLLQLFAPLVRRLKNSVEHAESTDQRHLWLSPT